MTAEETAPRHAAFAQVGSAYYPALAAVFTALVIISNVTATKGVAFGPIITDGGFIVFPLTYVIGDVLSEVYGFKATRRVIFLGFAMNALAALAFWVTIYLPAADFYTNQEHFENIVHAYTQLIVAGLAGFIVGPVTDTGPVFDPGPSTTGNKAYAGSFQLVSANGTAIWHHVGMPDEHPLILRQAAQTPQNFERSREVWNSL